jgi:argininosuccinate lyase
LWQSRLFSPPADELLGFTESLSFDQQLGAYDILKSKAHVRGLVYAKLLSEEEQRLLDALDAAREEL